MRSKSPPTIEQLSADTTALANVVNNEPDLACVLITGSFLDQCLAALLSRYFVDGSTSDNLLSHKGSLGTFASRVAVSYSLGLITKAMKLNLDVIGDIRNLCGHTHLMLDFNREDLRELCMKLSFPKVHHVIGGDGGEPFSKVKGPRNRFCTVAFLLAHRLLLTGLATVKQSKQDNGWE